MTGQGLSYFKGVVVKCRTGKDKVDLYKHGPARLKEIGPVTEAEHKRPLTGC
jgi:hypothetical protein